MFKYGQKVKTPLGIGRIFGKVVVANGREAKWGVDFSQKDFKKPEDWKRISPAGGPSKTLYFDEKDIEELEA